MIFNDVLQALEDRRSPVILTERKDHALLLAGRISRFARNVIVLTGGIGAKQRRAAMQRLGDVSATDERVLIATGRYIGEGFDDARLDTLFLAMPIAWKGTLAQYVGRLHRLYPAKREVVVYDYGGGSSRKGDVDKHLKSLVGPGRTRTCNQTVMSGRILSSFVDFAAL